MRTALRCGIAMIINHWGSEFTRLYGHHFPRSYLALDCEYTGGNAERDLILEIGHTLVSDCLVTDQLSLILDWTHHPVVPDAWLRDALERAERRAEIAGNGYRLTYQVMQREGIRPPERVLEFYHDFFQKVRKGIGFFAAHNGYYADVRMLKSAFERFLGRPLQLGNNTLFDTGGIEKASQCLVCDEPRIRDRKDIWLPKPGDTLESYFRRVTGMPAAGIYWNMGYCVKKHQLAERFDLDLRKQHTAQFDSLLVHYLMEEYRGMITHDHSGEHPFESLEATARAFEQGIAKTKTRCRGQRSL